MLQFPMPQRGRAAALLAAGAVVAGASAALPSAEAEAGPVSRFMDPVLHQRPVHERNGPFFALRVHSMDVAAEAENLAAFEYACRDFVPGSEPERYDLVRTVFKGRVDPSECDEVMSLLVRGDAKAEFHARLGTTRWIRRSGPAGTPVGGFVGRMEVGATVTLASGEILPDLPILDLRLAGTTGLRPMRGNPDDATALDEDRCAAPRHDEGWYLGGFDRRTLLRVLAKDSDDPARIAFVRTLARTIVGGTFEGRLVLDPDPATDTTPVRWDYSKIARAGWWFDGLAAADCKPVRARPSPAAEASAEVAVDVDVSVDVR